MAQGLMNCQFMLSNAWIGIKLVCLAAVMSHLTSIVYDKHNPESTIGVTEKTQLDKIDFPAVFKVCMTPGFNETELRQVGYSNTWGYFHGQSKYKKQIFGWSGHTKDGQPFSNASDVQNRIFHNYHSVINSTLVGMIHNDSYEQDQGDLCRSPGFYFDLDFILRKF